MAKGTPRRRSKRHQELVHTLTFFLVTLLSIAGLIFYLWVYSEIDETLLAIEIQQETVHELTNSLQELKSEIARQERVDRITAVARTHLGMVVARPETLAIYIPPGGGVR